MIRRFGYAVLSMAIVAAGAGWYVWHELHTAPPLPVAEVTFTIPEGSGLRQVAARLQQLGILRHPRLFAAWARYTGGDRGIRSGTYRLRESVTPIQLLELLQRGPALDHIWVTIPEGYAAAQIAALLETKGLGGVDVFSCAMRDPGLLLDLDLPMSGTEGYLFPDTYAFTRTTSAEAVIRTLVGRFRRESADLAARREAAGISEQEMVVLASVIEKETGLAEERPLISAVFHNRLRLGMPLQSDPTVIYGLTDFDGNLTREHLADLSPYNTYVHKGLPPGPIANPGRASLEAAIEPARSDALYFVSRGDGSHQFSRSLIEHNRAVHQFQKRRR